MLENRRGMLMRDHIWRTAREPREVLVGMGPGAKGWKNVIGVFRAKAGNFREENTESGEIFAGVEGRRKWDVIGVFRENVGNFREGKRRGEKRARRRLDLSLPRFAEPYWPCARLLRMRKRLVFFDAFFVDNFAFGVRFFFFPSGSVVVVGWRRRLPPVNSGGTPPAPVAGSRCTKCASWSSCVFLLGWWWRRWIGSQWRRDSRARVDGFWRFGSPRRRLAGTGVSRS